MTLPIQPVDLDARVGAAEVVRFSRNVPDNVDRAISDAWSVFRSEAGNVWTLDSIDALTPGALPGEARVHIVSHAVDLLAAGSAKDQEIVNRAEDARQWRIRLARNQVRCFDGVLAPRALAAAGDDSIRVLAPSSFRFDPCDPRGSMRRRDPLI